MQHQSDIFLSEGEKALWPECDPWSEKCLLPKMNDAVGFLTKEHQPNHDGKLEIVTTAGVKNPRGNAYGYQELFATDQVIELQRKTWKMAVSWAQEKNAIKCSPLSENLVLVKFHHTKDKHEKLEGLFIMFAHDFQSMIGRSFKVKDYQYQANMDDFRVMSSAQNLIAAMQKLPLQHNVLSGMNPFHYMEVK